MKKLKKDQRGFTLIELVIVIALTGIITAAITMTIFQVFNMNTRTANRMTAVSQVLNAGKIVSEDVLEAQSVTPGGCTNCVVSLNWTEVGGNQTTHRIKYTLIDGRLTREDLALNSTTIAAEHITVASVTPPQPCSFPNCGAYNFTVTATVGGQSETRVYQVKPRPGS